MNEVQEHIEKKRADASQKYSNFAGHDGLKVGNNSHLLASAKFRLILASDTAKKDLVGLLNKFGITTNSNAYDNVLISNTLQGLKMKNNFKDDFLNLLNSITSKKSFADQSNGFIRSLNADDMISAVYNSGKDFKPDDNFSSDCKNCDGAFKNFDWGDVTDLLQTGATTYTTENKDAAATQIANDSVATAQAQAAAAAAAAQAATNQGNATVAGASVTEKIVITVGILGILGIASYFYFKKVKVHNSI